MRVTTFSKISQNRVTSVEIQTQGTSCLDHVDAFKYSDDNLIQTLQNIESKNRIGKIRTETMHFVSLGGTT